MKKYILLIILFVFIVGNAISLPEFRFSVGGGAYFTSDFGGGGESSVSGFGKYMSIETPYAGGWAYVLLDATFLELSLGFFGVGGKWEMFADTSIVTLTK